jgi:predicted RNA-binding Zn-ribbon protein involved in translation (DUF1610 family)
VEYVTPICPECGSEDSVTQKRNEVRVATYDVQVYVDDQGNALPLEGDEPMDVDYQDSEPDDDYTCHSCGYDTPELSDFIEDPDEEDED